MKINLLIIAIISFSLAGCSTRDSNNISVYDLLKTSKESVSFAIVNDKSVDAIFAWIKDEKPSSVQLACNNDKKLCDKLDQKLKNANIEIIPLFDIDDKLIASFDRNSAQNCKPGVFGCSVSVNQINHVSNYNQFLNPAISDYAPAR